MSTLKTNNFEHLDASSPNITLGIGGGVNISGIATAETGLRVPSGNIGIGTDVPGQKLHIIGDGSPVILLEDGSGTDQTFTRYKSSAYNWSVGADHEDGSFVINRSTNLRTGDPELYIGSNGNIGIGLTNPATKLNLAGTIRLENSSDDTQYLSINYQGINFQNTGAGSSSTAASHLLDDYEEGTFTPVLLNDGSTTYTTQVGRYTKVGNIVYINALVRINSVSGGSGVTGFTLPFQNDSGAHAVGLLVGNNSWSSNFSDANLAGWMADGSNEMRFYYNSGQNLEAIAVSNIGDSSEAAIQATYRTND